MLREKAQAKCDSDPKCLGLHWLNNAGAVRIDHGDWVNFGKDGRTVTTGMYQGCGGTLAATVNNDWDIIVKPSQATTKPTSSKSSMHLKRSCPNR